MINLKKVIAIIPARGGSKRLPKKNILSFNGRPLISLTIDAAKSSKYIDEVIVSTDCDEIKYESIKYGAKVPFKRPADLSRDTSTTEDATLYTLNKLGNHLFDIAVILQPTSPLRTVSDIDNALSIFERKRALGVISVCECEHSPLWCNSLPPDKNMEYFINPSIQQLRSQDLPKQFRLNGAVYCYDVQHIIKSGGFFYSNRVFAYTMPQQRSIDIDNKLDFDTAELLSRKF